MFSYCYISDCDALKSEGVQVNRRQSLKVDLATFDAKHEALKKELEQLGIKKNTFITQPWRSMRL